VQPTPLHDRLLRAGRRRPSRNACPGRAS